MGGGADQLGRSSGLKGAMSLPADADCGPHHPFDPASAPGRVRSLTFLAELTRHEVKAASSFLAEPARVREALREEVRLRAEAAREPVLESSKPLSHTYLE